MALVIMSVVAAYWF